MAEEYEFRYDDYELFITKLSDGSFVIVLNDKIRNLYTGGDFVAAARIIFEDYKNILFGKSDNKLDKLGTLCFTEIFASFSRGHELKVLRRIYDTDTPGTSDTPDAGRIEIFEKEISSFAAESDTPLDYIKVLYGDDLESCYVSSNYSFENFKNYTLDYCDDFCAGKSLSEFRRIDNIKSSKNCLELMRSLDCRRGFRFEQIFGMLKKQWLFIENCVSYYERSEEGAGKRFVGFYLEFKKDTRRQMVDWHTGPTFDKGIYYTILRNIKICEGSEFDSQLFIIEYKYSLGGDDAYYRND